METAIALLGLLLAGVIGWILSHSAQCNRFHERVARLEERLGMRDNANE